MTKEEMLLQIAIDAVNFDDDADFEFHECFDEELAKQLYGFQYNSNTEEEQYEEDRRFQKQVRKDTTTLLKTLRQQYKQRTNNT